MRPLVANALDLSASDRNLWPAGAQVAAVAALECTPFRQWKWVAQCTFFASDLWPAGAQVAALVAALECTRAHYIRCINPNTRRTPCQAGPLDPRALHGPLGHCALSDLFDHYILYF